MLFYKKLRFFRYQVHFYTNYFWVQLFNSQTIIFLQLNIVNHSLKYALRSLIQEAFMNTGMVLPWNAMRQYTIEAYTYSRVYITN